MGRPGLSGSATREWEGVEGEFADGKGGLFVDNVNLKSFHDLAGIAAASRRGPST